MGIGKIPLQFPIMWSWKIFLWQDGPRPLDHIVKNGFVWNFIISFNNYILIQLFNYQKCSKALNKMCKNIYITEIKNAPNALLSYISMREFLRTLEKCEKHLPSARASPTSLVFLKIAACLYNSTMHSVRFLFL